MGRKLKYKNETEKRAGKNLLRMKRYGIKKHIEILEKNTIDGLKTCQRTITFNKESEIKISFSNVLIKKPNYDWFKDMGWNTINDFIPNEFKKLELLDELMIQNPQSKRYIHAVYITQTMSWNHETGHSISYEFKKLTTYPFISIISQLFFHPIIHSDYKVVGGPRTVAAKTIGQIYNGMRYRHEDNWVDGEKYKLIGVSHDKMTFQKIEDGTKTPIPNPNNSFIIKIEPGQAYQNI